MKLTELNTTTHSKKVLADYFDTKIDTKKLSPTQRTTMLKKVNAMIGEVKSTSKVHTSEKNPTYLKLLVLKEALVTDGNEFVAARLAAIKKGESHFTVGGKKYKVTGDTSDELEEGFMPDEFDGKLEDGTTYRVEIDMHDEAGYIPKPITINGKPAHMAEQDVYDRVMDDANEEIANADIDVPMEDKHSAMQDELRDLEMDIDNTPIGSQEMKMKKARHSQLMKMMKSEGHCGTHRKKNEGEHDKPEIATYYKPKKNVPDLKTFLKKNRNVVMDPQTGSYTTRAKLKKKDKAGREADAVISYVANMPKESKQVTESEVEQAQVILAAQDMVDKIQGYIEDISNMRYEDLPAVVDQMRNELGVNHAQTFADASVGVLDTLLTQLNDAKASMEGSMSGITGQAPITADSMDEPVDDMEPADAPPADDAADLEPEADPTDNLGREKRD